MLLELSGWEGFWDEAIVIFFQSLSIGILIIGFAQALIYFLQLPLAALGLFKKTARDQESNARWLESSEIVLPVSIIVPAYNEEVTIVKSVQTSLALRHPAYEVIVANDGSIDGTLEVLKKEFQLVPSKRTYEYLLPCQEIIQVYRSLVHPNLVVIDKKNGGKADALNASINLSRYPVFCTLDADSILDPKSLLKATKPFIEDPEGVIVVGGTIQIFNGNQFENGIIKRIKLPRNPLALFQVNEYIRAFLIGRLSLSNIGILTIISGAFALIQKEAAVAVGGFDTNTIGEDLSLIVKLYRRRMENQQKIKVEFIPETVCWTEAPETFKVLKSQRIRWQQGMLETFFRNKIMLFNPQYKRIGTIAFPMLLILDIFGPLAELAGYILMPGVYAAGLISMNLLLTFYALFIGMGVFISIVSLLLQEFSGLRKFNSINRLLILLACACLENVGYRQLNGFYRIIAWWRFIRKKQVWGDMKRKGTK